MRSRFLVCLTALYVFFSLITTPYADGPQRPLLFIPGILGSKLSDESGNTIWGDRNSLANYGTLDLPPGSDGGKLKASGLISSINVLGPFWTIHQCDDLLSLLQELGYEDEKTLFVFPYDWRLSNFVTAKRLDRFVQNTPALLEGNFDIVAHSMGGLITRIWMARHQGAAKVHKVIYLSTPFLGSMNSLDTISSGWGPFANLVAGGIARIRHVTLSFPSIYELFPAYADCCRVGSKDNFSTFDVLDANIWKGAWLPAEYRPGGAHRSILVSGLQSARALRSLIAIPPSGTEEIRITGDILETKLWLYTPSPAASPDQWTFTSSRGDGTVPIWSAANNFKSLEGTEPSFAEHATIFADKYVRSRLARELIPSVAPPVRGRSLGEVVTTEGIRHLSNVRAKIEPPLVRPGDRALVHIELSFQEPTSFGAVVPIVEMNHDASTDRIAVSEFTSPQDIKDHRLTYSAVLTAPQREDTYEVRVTVADQGTTSVYLTTAIQAP